MRYLAIDYGLKRLGLALCDASETIVSPLCQLQRDSKRPEVVLNRVKEIVAEYQIEALVVGLPLNIDGSEGGQAVVSRQFAEEVAGAVALPLHMQDERLSTAAADELLNESVLLFRFQKLIAPVIDYRAGNHHPPDGTRNVLFVWPCEILH